MARPIKRPLRPPSACPPMRRMALRRPRRTAVLRAFMELSLGPVWSGLNRLGSGGGERRHEFERVVFAVYQDGGAFGEIAVDQLESERVLDEPLDGAPHG